LTAFYISQYRSDIMYLVAVAAGFALPEKMCNPVLGKTVTSCSSFRALGVRTKPWRLSAVTRALGLTISFSSLMLAAGIPELYSFDAQLQDEFAWRFWVILMFLIVMTGRQLKRDVLTICTWMVPASVVTRPWPLVDDPPDVAACVTEESTELDAHSMSVSVLGPTTSSSAAPTPLPTAPIFLSRHGEKYHYSKLCCGLSLAEASGINRKTLCKFCDTQRSQ
jgi:hypothetical protein